MDFGSMLNPSTRSTSARAHWFFTIRRMLHGLQLIGTHICIPVWNSLYP